MYTTSCRFICPHQLASPFWRSPTNVICSDFTERVTCQGSGLRDTWEAVTTDFHSVLARLKESFKRKDMNQPPHPTTLWWGGRSAARPMSHLVCMPEAVQALQTPRRACSLASALNNDPLGCSREPLITQSMVHYPRGDPSSSGRRVHIDWHNNNSLPDHLTFTITLPTRNPRDHRRLETVIDTYCRCRRPRGGRGLDGGGGDGEGES